MKPIPLSAARLAELKAELERRITIDRPEIRERVSDARALGDLKENAEYAASRDDQARNEGRIHELDDIIKRAVIVETSGSDDVTMASTVTIRKCADDSVRTYTLVSPAEADIAAGKLSVESAIGSALMGHRAGDIVSATTPVGVQEYEILSVE